MADIHGRVTTSQGIGGRVSTKSAVNGNIDPDVRDRLYRDYNLLHNKPSIEGVELKGDKTLEDLGIERFLYGTLEYWNSYPDLIAQMGSVYVYTDYREINGQLIPGFKFGDGTSYLIDIDFIDIEFQNHIDNEIVHITQNERSKWNNKVSVSIDPLDENNLIFSIG